MRVLSGPFLVRVRVNFLFANKRCSVVERRSHLVDQLLA